MRQIRFRGYDKIGKNGWVYGDFVHGKGISPNPKIDMYPRSMVGGYEVHDDSVGQFVGIHDSYDVDIYEGDIVETIWFLDRRPIRGVIEYKDTRFVIASKNYSICMGLKKDTYIKVVGNIFEQSKIEEK